MGNIVGENFYDYVRDQINVRQKYYGDREINASYVNKKKQALYANTGWAKMVSSVNVDDYVCNQLGIDPNLYNSNRLAKKAVLFAGLSEEYVDQQIIPPSPSQTSLSGSLIETYVTNLRAGINNSGDIINNSAYGFGGLDFGQVPLPGIVDVSVTHKNRGSLREAQIRIKAYNKNQFAIIETLYLRLGYTVLLEWGHTVFIDNQENISGPDSLLSQEFLAGNYHNNPNQTNGLDYYSVLNQIAYNQSKHNGNYDAMCGKVTNFNWDFNPDGSYDINVTLISIGDVIESLKIDNIFSDSTEVQEDKERLIDSLVNGAVKLEWSFSLTVGVYVVYKEDGTTIQNGDINEYYDGHVSLYSNEIHWTAWNESGARKAARDYYTTYVESITSGASPYAPGAALTATSLAALTTELGKILYSYMYILNNSAASQAAGTPVYSTPSGNIIYHYANGSGTNATSFRIDFRNPGVTSNMIPSQYYIRLGHLLYLLEERIIFKYKRGNNFKPGLTIDYSNNNYFYINQYTFGADIFKAISRNVGYKFYRISSNPSYNLIDLPSQCKMPLKYDYGVGNLMNVMINMEWISETILNSIQNGGLILFDFLKDLCDGINVSFGGVNQIEPVIDETQNRVYLVDKTPLLLNEDQKKNFLQYKTPAKFQIYGFESAGASVYDVDGNFIKKFSIRSEITNNLATQLSIGAQAVNSNVTENATGFQSWNRGLTDRIAPQKVDADKRDPTVTPPENFTDLIDEIKSLLLKYEEKNIGKNEVQALIAHNKTIQQRFSANLALQTQAITAGAASFIPINLNLDMVGLAGMKIYNTFDVNTKFLPINYEDKLKFLIKKISHRISNSKWETTIETLVTPKVKTVDIRQIAESTLPFPVTSAFSGLLPIAQAALSGSMASGAAMTTSSTTTSTTVTNTTSSVASATNTHQELIEKSTPAQRLMAMLDLIAWSEGTDFKSWIGSNKGYDRVVNAPSIKSGNASLITKVAGRSTTWILTTYPMSTHPGVVMNVTPTLPSSATGRYQFLETTWKSIAQKYGVTEDFNKLNQDYLALALMNNRDTKLFKYALNGDIHSILSLTSSATVNSRSGWSYMGLEWASFPNSPWGQSSTSQTTYENKYWDFLQTIVDNNYGPGQNLKTLLESKTSTNTRWRLPVTDAQLGTFGYIFS